MNETDLISRQDVLGLFQDALDSKSPNLAENWKKLIWIREHIAELPSAQAERKTGRWIPYKYGDERWHQCTACGVADKYIDYVKGYDGETGKLVSVRNYCPNCGADMRGDDDGGEA